MSPVLFVWTDGGGAVGGWKLGWLVNKAACCKVERLGFVDRMPAQQVTVKPELRRLQLPPRLPHQSSRLIITWLLRLLMVIRCPPRFHLVLQELKLSRRWNVGQKRKIHTIFSVETRQTSGLFWMRFHDTINLVFLLISADCSILAPVWPFISVNVIRLCSAGSALTHQSVRWAAEVRSFLLTVQ